MTDTSQPGGDASTSAQQPPASPEIERSAPADTPSRVGVSEAARILASLRRPKEQAQPERAREAAPAPQESTAPAEDAAPRIEESGAPGETQAAEPEAQQEQPPIEPPRSWTKEAKERWQSLPHDTQQYLAEREQERERELRRSQNEAAEKLKGLTAREQEVEKARQQYEQALPVLLQNVRSAMSGEFADIQTWQDVETLAKNDWPRYLQWDAKQKQVNALQQEWQTSQQRQSEEWRQKWDEFARNEDKALAEKIPDMADPDKAQKLQKRAMTALNDVGFSDDELAKAWHGQLGLSIRDHRVQSLIVDAVRWREAQENKTAVTKKPLPPVQRPGTAPAKGAHREAEIKDLETRLENASGVNAIRAAAQLVRARRSR